MPRLLRICGLPVLWGAIALLMLKSHQNDPFDPSVAGTARYGHNNPSDLQTFLIMTLIELGVVVLILRPWSYHRSWGRALTALLLYLPWTLLSIILMMHAGGVIALHGLWLMLLELILLVCLLWSAVASRLRAKR